MAVIFTLVHFPPLLILPLFVIGAIGWGVLARISNSILPGMVVHGLVDFVFFMWVFADTEAVNVEFYSATGPLATLPDDLFVEENLVTVDIGVAGTGILEPFDTDSLLLPCGSELIIGTTGGTFSDNGSGEVRGTGDARWIQASAVGFCGREVVFDYIGVADGFLTQLTVGP